MWSNIFISMLYIFTQASLFLFSVRPIFTSTEARCLVCQSSCPSGSVRLQRGLQQPSCQLMFYSSSLFKASPRAAQLPSCVISTGLRSHLVFTSPSWICASVTFRFGVRTTRHRRCWVCLLDQQLWQMIVLHQVWLIFFNSQMFPMFLYLRELKWMCLEPCFHIRGSSWWCTLPFHIFNIKMLSAVLLRPMLGFKP